MTVPMIGGHSRVAPRSTWLAVATFSLALSSTSVAAQEESAPEAETQLSPEARVVIESGLTFATHWIGFGLFAASFEIDAASCNASGSTTCGIAGISVGGILWLATQAIVSPLILMALSNSLGASVDEGWTYAGAAIATLSSLLLGGIVAYLAVYPAEGDIYAGIVTGLGVMSVLQTAGTVFAHEVSRPSGEGGASVELRVGSLRGAF